MSTNERECARGRRRSVNAVAVTERERSSGDGARARMMKRAVPLQRCITRHTPIGAYRERFFPEESTSCGCGALADTVQHVLRSCPRHSREDKPKEQLCYAWLVDFLSEKESAFAFDIH